MVTFSDVKKLLVSQLIISYTFLISGLFVNFLELLTLIFIWPINKRLYKRINYYLALLIWGNLTALAQWWSGSDFHLYCSEATLKNLGKENALSILNHHYDIDWLFGWILCQRGGLLGGTKVFNKTATKYLPIVGWSFWFSEMLFLKREWESDKKSLAKGVNAIIDNNPEDIPYNISILCEGTRFTPEKHKASMEVAKAKGLPLLKHHLLPRTKGFTLLAETVAGKVDFCYDITIGMAKVNGEKPTLKHIKDGIPVSFEIYIRRIPVSSIPTHDEKASAAWLQQLYREKDEIFDVYDRTGSFGETAEIKKHYLKKDGYDLYVAIGWLLVIAVPSIFYLIMFLINGAWYAKLILLVGFAIVNYVIKQLVKFTDSKKSSSDFGLSPKKKE